MGGTGGATTCKPSCPAHQMVATSRGKRSSRDRLRPCSLERAGFASGRLPSSTMVANGSKPISRQKYCYTIYPILIVHQVAKDFCTKFFTRMKILRNDRTLLSPVSYVGVAKTSSGNSYVGGFACARGNFTATTVPKSTSL